MNDDKPTAKHNQTATAEFLVEGFAEPFVLKLSAPMFMFPHQKGHIDQILREAALKIADIVINHEPTGGRANVRP